MTKQLNRMFPEFITNQPSRPRNIAEFNQQFPSRTTVNNGTSFWGWNNQTRNWETRPCPENAWNGQIPTTYKIK